MGVRKTNCRGRLARSGTIARSLPQLAKMLTIQDLQNCERRTRINSSPVKKTNYLFGLPLARAKLLPSRGTGRRHALGVRRSRFAIHRLRQHVAPSHSIGKEWR